MRLNFTQTALDAMNENKLMALYARAQHFMSGYPETSHEFQSARTLLSRINFALGLKRSRRQHISPRA